MKINIDDLREKFSSFSNEQLIAQARDKYNDYIPEVQEIIVRELEKRDIDHRGLIMTQTEHDAALEKDGKTYNRIRGWLKVYVVQCIIIEIIYFVFMISSFLGGETALGFVLFLFFSYLLVALIFTFLKKKIAKFLNRIFLGLLSVLGIINAFALVTSDKTDSEKSGGIAFVASIIAWFFYFLSSRRVSETLRK